MDMQIIETGFKWPCLADFAPTTFKGDTPARRDIIEGRLPRGKVILLAGEGDVGKSWQLLTLFEAMNHGADRRAFGGRVLGHHLPCLLLLGEDDRASVDLRLKTIRGATKARPGEHGAIITAPDIGYMPLVRADYDGSIRPTDVLVWLEAQIEGMKAFHGEMGFVAIDTWSTFFPIDANSPHEVQAAMNFMTHLATKHDVCIIITHHMNKGASTADLRKGIRGSTAIPDGTRGAYVMYKIEADEAQQIREETCIEHDGDVVRLQIVKNNLGLRRDPVTYVREPDGCLRDVSEMLGARLSPEDALLQVIQEANEAGQKLTRTGTNGLYANRSPTWPGGLGNLAKGRLEALANGLVAKGRVRLGEKGLLLAVSEET